MVSLSVSSTAHGDGQRPVKRVTMKDVAAVAGVSVNSVSMVFRDERGISEDTAARIKSAARKLGYEFRPKRRRNGFWGDCELLYVPTITDANIARSYCKAWVGRGVEWEELSGEATVALMKAAATFDPTRGVAFQTHLLWCVRTQLSNRFGYRFKHLRELGVSFVEGDAPLEGEGDVLTVFDTLVDHRIQEQEEMKAYVAELLEFAIAEEFYVLSERYLEGKTIAVICRESRREEYEVVDLIETGLSRIRAGLGLEGGGCCES